MNNNIEDKIKSAQQSFISDYAPSEELSLNETKQLEEKLNEKVKKTKGRHGLLGHLGALKNYLFDNKVLWYRKAVVVAALVYFITPLDAMPDVLPFLGYLDDIGVIAWTIKFLGEEIRSYY